MRLKNPFVERDTVRKRIRTFMKKNGITSRELAEQMHTQIGVVVKPKWIWQEIERAQTSYERLDQIAKCLIAVGMKYKPLPPHDDIQRHIRAYMDWRGFTVRDVLRHGRSIGVYRGSPQNYRQFKTPNYRIFKRIIEILEDMG